VAFHPPALRAAGVVARASTPASAPTDAASSSSPSPAIATAKADLLAAVAADDEAAIASAADRLSSLAGPGPPPPSPSTWRTLYSNAAGPSGGRVGPLKGRVTQKFHADATYTNSLALGPPGLAQLDLSGTWEAVRPDRVNVVFRTTAWRLFGGLLKGGSTFGAKGGKPPPRGHWSLLFGDDDVRVFRTNKGSLFVLGREEEGE
jgi:hypothetical protein